MKKLWFKLTAWIPSTFTEKDKTELVTEFRESITSHLFFPLQITRVSEVGPVVEANTLITRLRELQTKLAREMSDTRKAYLALQSGKLEGLSLAIDAIRNLTQQEEKT